MQVEHVAIWAQDIDQLKTFYETYFGARASARYVNPRKQFASYFLEFGAGARLELMQRPGLADRAGDEQLGWAHVAMAVGSETAVDQLTQRLLAAGYQLVDGPRRTGDGYYESVILDPEGNRVEITV